MANQKYTVGQNVILLEIGTRLPAVTAEIIGFVAENSSPYRIRYQRPGDETIWTDDVTEDRLTTLAEIGLQNVPKT